MRATLSSTKRRGARLGAVFAILLWLAAPASVLASSVQFDGPVPERQFLLCRGLFDGGDYRVTVTQCRSISNRLGESLGEDHPYAYGARAVSGVAALQYAQQLAETDPEQMRWYLEAEKDLRAARTMAIAVEGACATSTINILRSLQITYLLIGDYGRSAAAYEAMGPCRPGGNPSPYGD